MPSESDRQFEDFFGRLLTHARDPHDEYIPCLGEVEAEPRIDHQGAHAPTPEEQNTAWFSWGLAHPGQGTADCHEAFDAGVAWHLDYLRKRRSS